MNNKKLFFIALILSCFLINNVFADIGTRAAPIQYFGLDEISISSNYWDDLFNYFNIVEDYIPGEKKINISSNVEMHKNLTVFGDVVIEGDLIVEGSGGITRAGSAGGGGNLLDVIVESCHKSQRLDSKGQDISCSVTCPSDHPIRLGCSCKIDPYHNWDDDNIDFIECSPIIPNGCLVKYGGEEIDVFHFANVYAYAYCARTTTPSFYSTLVQNADASDFKGDVKIGGNLELGGAKADINNIGLKADVNEGFYSPTVFEKDGERYLITGSEDGDFEGYKWNGDKWEDDFGIVQGLENPGAFSSPDVFKLDNIMYLITGNEDGDFVGYRWYVSDGWLKDNIADGLENDGNYSNTGVFYDADGSGERYLIVGNENSILYQYVYRTSIWGDKKEPSLTFGEKNSISIFEGDFKKDEKYKIYLIAGNKDGFKGAAFNKETGIWTYYNPIKEGLDNHNNNTPEVFKDGNDYYLISGSTNEFVSYKWDETKWQENKEGKYKTTGLLDHPGSFAKPNVFLTPFSVTRIFWSKFIWLRCASSEIQITFVRLVSNSVSSVNLCMVVKNTPPLCLFCNNSLKCSLLSTLNTLLSPIKPLALVNCSASWSSRSVRSVINTIVGLEKSGLFINKRVR